MDFQGIYNLHGQRGAKGGCLGLFGLDAYVHIDNIYQRHYGITSVKFQNI